MSPTVFLSPSAWISPQGRSDSSTLQAIDTQFLVDGIWGDHMRREAKRANDAMNSHSKGLGNVTMGQQERNGEYGTSSTSHQVFGTGQQNVDQYAPSSNGQADATQRIHRPSRRDSLARSARAMQPIPEYTELSPVSVAKSSSAGSIVPPTPSRAHTTGMSPQYSRQTQSTGLIVTRPDLGPLPFEPVPIYVQEARSQWLNLLTGVDGHPSPQYIAIPLYMPFKNPSRDIIHTNYGVVKITNVSCSLI